MHAITESGAPRGASHLLFWNPPPINPDLGIRASARSQVSKLARLTSRRVENVVFANRA
jgi:DEAD/DEAH box helicase domain-containing protein